MRSHKAYFLAAIVMSVAACTSNVISSESKDGYTLVYQTKGPTLGYSPTSGVQIIERNGYAFKDLNRNGKLDAYEDWRKNVNKRASNLISQLTLEEMCGLMLVSSSVDIIASGQPSRDQQEMLEKEHMRHLLIRNITSTEAAVTWSNTVQAFCEAARLGIPANLYSGPRNYTSGSVSLNKYKADPDEGFDQTKRADISKWPRELGLAATFDMDIIKKYGKTVSRENRALGITTTVSPQIDIASDPRWRRFHGSFGEDPILARDIATVYCDAVQTTSGSSTGWGTESVNCMVKHWPGAGTEEGGRDPHFGTGKYSVYPGNGFDAALFPFVEGAFKLRGKTGKASAIMPYYTIAYDQDPSGEKMASGFSKYIVQGLLRDKYKYNGVVCTVGGISKNYSRPWKHSGKPWGMEKQEEVHRVLQCIEAGVDQLNGSRDIALIMDAYKMYADKHGDDEAKERLELSCGRVLMNIFRVGLFENPYIDMDISSSVVGCVESVKAGYEAQLKSIVLLKNSGAVIPVKERLKVYEPVRHVDAGVNDWQKSTPAYEEYPISPSLLGKYYDVVDSPDDADFALVGIKSPVGHWGFIKPCEEYPEGHYSPISLQWGPYKATTAREHSIAADPEDGTPDRTYRDIVEVSSNANDAVLVQETKKAMGDKPVIVVVAAERPFVPAEIEPWADALLFYCGVSGNAVLDIVSGAAEPYGLLPCQLPANMETVEAQCEDVPHDMECYKDAQGNVYDFAFGLNWNGIINDSRVKRYKH